MGQRLRRNRALARQAQPGFQLLPIDAELTGAKLQDLQRRLDRVDDLARTSSRRADIARWTLCAADQAQPCAAVDEPGSYVLREPRSLVIFVERVKAAAVEHELERARRTALRSGSRRSRSGTARAPCRAPCRWRVARRRLPRSRTRAAPDRSRWCRCRSRPPARVRARQRATRRTRPASDRASQCPRAAALPKRSGHSTTDATFRQPSIDCDAAAFPRISYSGAPPATRR